MDYATLNEAIDGMTDEQLLLVEKKTNEERYRRLAVSLSSSSPTGKTEVLIDLAPLTNSIREGLRQEVLLLSEPAMASLLEQIGGWWKVEEADLIAGFRTLLSAALVHEAQCEIARRLDSVK